MEKFFLRISDATFKVLHRYHHINNYIEFEILEIQRKTATMFECRNTLNAPFWGHINTNS